MKKYKGLIITVVVILVLGLLKFFFGAKKPESGGKPGAGAKMPVKIGVKVVQGEMVSPAYRVSGTLIANEQVNLSSETSGLIRHVFFKEGAAVAKGELLLKLNDADFQAQLKKAIAVKKLKEDNARRNEILLKKEALSQADYELSLNELASIDADIDYLNEMIRKTEVRAPFAGTIGLRNVSAGAYINANTILATLEDKSKLKIEFSVPEKYAMKVRVGDDLSFTLSGSEEVFKAKIYAADASVSNDTRSIRMRALVNQGTYRLMPGLFANITLNLGSEHTSFMIPNESLVPILKGQKVFVVQGDSAVERMVKTGFRNETQIEVLEGLKSGDSLIVDGIMYMKAGVKVKVGSSKK